MYQLETSYWWFVARRKLLKWAIGSALKHSLEPMILDVGCGTGSNGAVLRQFGPTVSADSSPEALRFARLRGLDPMVCCAAENLPFNTGSFDVVTALDLLEHLEDDNAGLKELTRVCKSEGLLFVTVPAYGFLWSEHDEALHHHRRYTAYELRNKLRAGGLEVERVTYFITFLFVPILLTRIFQNIFKRSVEPKTHHIILPSWLNSLLIGILAVERSLLRWVNLPVGVSLVCWARKSNGMSETPGAQHEEEFVGAVHS